MANSNLDSILALMSSVYNITMNATDFMDMIHGLSYEQQSQLLKTLQDNNFTLKPRPEVEPREDPELVKYLYLYVPPIILIFGTIGNVMCFTVLMLRSMRAVSTYNYLAALSVADALVLYVGLLPQWLKTLNVYDIETQSAWTCKLIVFLGYSCSDYSVWLLIAVTVERYIAIVHSLYAPSMCTRSIAWKVMLALLCIVLLINSHFLWTATLRNVEKYGPVCGAKEGYVTLIEVAWPWIDACIYSFVPFIVIILLNSTIINQVLVSKRVRNQMAQTSATASSYRKSNHRASVQESSVKITVMLLTISFTFLCTTLPFNVTFIVKQFLTKGGTGNLTAKQEDRLSIVFAITGLLMYANHSMNFFLYLVTGQKFRQQLRTLFCRRSNTPTSPPHSRVQGGGMETSGYFRMERISPGTTNANLKAISENGTSSQTLKP